MKYPTGCASLLLAAAAAAWPVASRAAAETAWPVAPRAATVLDTVVVTANRSAQRLVDVATSMEVVDAETLERTVGSTFLDLLKKNASVDVIQYPNGLAGVGLRGMRPSFEFTINPRTLTLVDGRPSGSTSFTTISPESIERVEVLKGPASALYGASAMGGVVNIITRRSSGPIEGRMRLGYGSFDAYRGDAALGGTLSGRTDFDLALGYFDQHGNFRSGAGDKRPNSDARRVSGKLRLGADLSDIVRADITLDGADLSNNAPGPLSFNPQSRSANDTERLGGDLRFVLTPQDHTITLVGYTSREDYRYTTVPVAAARYQSSRTVSRYAGLQSQDTWALRDGLSLTYGVDWQRVETERSSFNAAGANVSPFSPNEQRDSRAVFAELGTHLLEEQLVLTLGARNDWITARTLETPYKTGFTPGKSEFTSFNPRGGVVYKLDERWRIHASAGTAFAPPQGSEIAGENEEFAGSQRRVTVGNPDLDPERNSSYDFGVGYGSGQVSADLTYFDARIRDRIRSVIVSETPDLRMSSYENANRSRMRGMEGTWSVDAGALFGLAPRRVGISTSITHLLQAEDIDNGVAVQIRNVAKWKGNVALTVGNARDLSTTLVVRHTGVRYDNDNSQGRIYTGGTGGVFANDRFTVVDLSARWDVTRHNTLRLELSNLLDRDYYEKADYPMPGRAGYLSYTLGF